MLHFNRIQKTSFLLLVLIGFCLPAKAQSRYHAFYFRGHWGLCDSAGIEIIKPEYEEYENSVDKDFYCFKHRIFSDLPGVIFNTRAGNSRRGYERADFDAVVIEGQFYSKLYKGKQFTIMDLRAEKRLQTQEAIDNLQNLGSHFLIAQLVLPAYHAVVKTVDNVPFSPPALIKEDYTPEDEYVMYRNRLPLQAVLKIRAQAFKTLFTRFTMNAQDKALCAQWKTANFDYFVFRQDKTLRLYDTAFKLIAILPYPRDRYNDELDDTDVEDLVSAFLNKRVYAFIDRGAGTIEDQIDTAQLPMTPDFELLAPDSTNVYTFIRNRDKKILFTTPFYTTYNEYHLMLDVEEAYGQKSSFHVNRETGALLLPGKYRELLKLQMGP